MEGVFPKSRGVSPQSGSYLGLADEDGLREEGPDDALETGRGGQGPVVPVIAVQVRGQQLLDAEGGDGHGLPCGGEQLWGAGKEILGFPLPLLTCVADAAEMPQDVVIGGVGVISHLEGLGRSVRG